MKISEVSLSIIIVNFNAGDFLYQCLKSLDIAKKDLDLDIWVVDNASSDGSLEIPKKEFPYIHFIENKENIGFGAANNIALKQVNTEYILLLNPDCYVDSRSLRFMLDFMQENPEVGAASCKVEKQDGSIDWASHRGFPTPWASFLYLVFKNDSLYHLTDRDMRHEHEVDAIAGAFFITRRSVLDKVGPPVGGFDEDYFLYAEDIDLCFRIKQAGFKIMYVPDVAVLHHKGISSGIKEHSQELSITEIVSRRKALNSFYETMKIFYKKHLAKDYPFFINWLVYLGINLKWKLAQRSMRV